MKLNVLPGGEKTPPLIIKGNKGPKGDGDDFKITAVTIHKTWKERTAHFIGVVTATTVGGVLALVVYNMWVSSIIG